MGCFTFSSRFRAKNAGRILMGLGLMFLALQAIVAVTAPMRDSQVLSPLLGAAAADPLIAMTIERFSPGSATPRLPR